MPSPASLARFTFMEISRVITIFLEVANGLQSSPPKSHNQTSLSSCLVPSFFGYMHLPCGWYAQQVDQKLTCMFLVMARSMRGQGDGISRQPIPRYCIDRMKHRFTSPKQLSHAPLKTNHPPFPTADKEKEQGRSSLRARLPKSPYRFLPRSPRRPQRPSSRSRRERRQGDEKIDPQDRHPLASRPSSHLRLRSHRQSQPAQCADRRHGCGFAVECWALVFVGSRWFSSWILRCFLCCWSALWDR